jgi:hypothetical protein
MDLRPQCFISFLNQFCQNLITTCRFILSCIYVCDYKWDLQWCLYLLTTYAHH